MLQNTPLAAVAKTWMLLLTILAAAGSGAEFRTTASGQSLIRPATFQQTLEELEGLDPLAVEVDAAATMLSDCGAPRGDGSCSARGCGTCGPCWTYWGSFEFLLWWRGGQDLPPLVTTGPSTTAAENAGVLGFPDTQILYATETQGGEARPGGRLTFGAWFDACQFSGAGVRLYMLGETTAHYDMSSDVVPVLARPFYNVVLDQQDADLVAYPGFTAGAVSVQNTSRVGGGDVFYRHLFFQDTCRRVDLIAGYQFATIDTDLMIASTRTSIRQDGSIPFGTVIENSDVFDTENRYHAGEIGLWGMYDRGALTWSVLAKVGLGTMNQRTEIRGRTVTSVPGLPPSVSDQGLLALGTNIGSYDRNVFTVAPEIAFQLAYHINDCLDLTCGYSFISWNHVAQPGDQIDPGINTSQIGDTLIGVARPEFAGQDASYQMHGLNFGVQWIW